MRSLVTVPMHYGSLYLAGDAAHLITPAGAKAANLAHADAGVLATAITRWLRDGRPQGPGRLQRNPPSGHLAGAGVLALAEQLVHAPADGDAFVAELQRARMDELRHPIVLDELLPAAWHRAERHANNHIEADHGRMKARLRPMRGLKQDHSAGTILAGHALIRNVRRGHYELAVEAPANRRVAVAFGELAAAI